MKQLAVVTVACLLTTVVVAKATQREQEGTAAGGYSKQIKDPCLKHQCDIGMECDLEEDGRPVCVCKHTCQETLSVNKVCSTDNETVSSECELYRQKCLCNKGHQDCSNSKNTHIQLDYYGPCKEIATCQKDEFEEYPFRIREWFYHVMVEMANRKDLNPAGLKMAVEAEQSSRKYVLPVMWRFCQLDTNGDRLVSSEELLAISASLKPLERCTGPFLGTCDPDVSGDITLEEWAHCLALEPEDVQDRCEELRSS